MTWKRNKDGGLDFDVTQVLNQEKAKENNVSWSAHTRTNLEGTYDVEFKFPFRLPTSLQQQHLKHRTKFDKMRDGRKKNYGAYRK